MDLEIPSKSFAVMAHANQEFTLTMFSGEKFIYRNEYELMQAVASILGVRARKKAKRKKK